MSGHRRRSSSLETDPEVSKRDGAPRRARPVSLVRTMPGTVDNQLAGQIFDHFCSSSTLKSILRSFRYLCEILRLKPNQFPYFYPRLKANLLSWKAQALWTKLDKRASQKCYNRGKACSGTRVLIIGAGPCGLRTAIEAQLLGAKVVVVEKRDRYSRNNVLHLWPYNIHDLRALGAKKFYGKFCAGAIDHISIRQLQCILLKVSLLLGVEVFEGVGFEAVIEPTDQETGWRARVDPPDHPVSQYEFDVLIGADGKRNTLAGFKRKEFRGKLAIAITANFINKHTEAEGRVEEISGVAFIFNQKFFNDLNQALGISLENIVYYKDETHYFVMTAKKQSLLNKGVLVRNHPDPTALLAPDNIDQEALFQYAREAADFATKGQLPHLDFAVNHYGKPDVAMFDFTSMYAADHSARVLERHGHRLLQCLVGDSLLEPFWPTGTGCPRGFFSAMDAMWLMKQMESGKMSILECLAERESINRILSQTTPENTCKNFNLCSIDPTTRYPTLNLKLVLPFQVTHLYDTDNPAHLQPQNVLQDSTPRKKKRKDSHISSGNLLSWIQTQVQPYNIQVPDMNTCFQNGLVLCAIINRYRPDLVHWDSLDPACREENIQLAFDILEQELGLQPVITGQEAVENEKNLDKLAVLSYLTGVYQLFRREIPQTQQEEDGQMDDLDDSVYYHNHREKMGREVVRKPLVESENISIGQLVANDAKRKKRRTMESLQPDSEGEEGLGERRVSNKKRLAKLMERAAIQDKKHESTVEKFQPLDIRREETFLKIQELMAGERRRDEGQHRDKKPQDLGRAIGRLDSEDWALKQIQEKMKETKGRQSRKEKVPKWSKEAFNDKLKKVKGTLENQQDVKQNHRIDVSLSRLHKKLTEGSTLETGERGANKVSALVGELAHKLDSNQNKPQLKREPSNVWQPPVVKSSRTSDNCHFCGDKVYVVERMSAEAKFFHRACFRCDYCNILLRLGSYVYHREGRFATKFFCIPHSTENALEKYKYKKKADEMQAVKEKRKEEDKGKKTLSPIQKERIKDIDRGATPERAEFEASLDVSAEEDRQIMDEDEWTDLNFGTSTNCANTSEDSLSDLETDVEAQGKSEKPLTADETRQLAREWRARQGYTGRVEEVRYTDQEYEDSSDCDLPAEVPKINRVRRRGRRISSSEGGSSEDSDDPLSDTEDSSDEELRELHRRDNNPFNNIKIPKIVVEPNSPLAVRKGDPDSKYVSQAIPLSGPTPPGTGLYKPSMSSFAKYQYKTPDYTIPPPQGPQYRTLSGVLSNNLKKNWVSGPANATQAQKKVDASEIDARLKSLMDRLSNQQSLLKPADKPSVQMQHYLDITGQTTHRKLSDTAVFVPYKPAPAPVPLTLLDSKPTNRISKDAAQIEKTNEDSYGVEPANRDSSAGETATNKELPVGVEPLVVVANQNAENEQEAPHSPLLSQNSDCESTNESESESSDSDGSESGRSDVEVLKRGQQCNDLPQIKINLVEPDIEESSPAQPCLEESSPEQPCHKESIPEQPCPEKSSPEQSCPAQPSSEESKIRQESVVNVTPKSQPVGLHGHKVEPRPVNPNLASPETSELICDTEPSCDIPSSKVSNDSQNDIEQSAETVEPRNESNSKDDSPPKRRNPPIRRPSLLKTVVNIKSDDPVTVVNYELIDQNFDSIDFIDDGSSSGESPDKSKEFDPQLVQAVNIYVERPLEYSEPSNYEGNGMDLLIVRDHGEPAGAGVNESSTDPDPPAGGQTSTKHQAGVQSHEEVGREERETEVWAILKSKNSSEKTARLNQVQQKQSNIVHDLIMGIPRQRRVRQPRATIPSSSVPPPPVAGEAPLAYQHQPLSPLGDSSTPTSPLDEAGSESSAAPLEEILTVDVDNRAVLTNSITLVHSYNNNSTTPKEVVQLRERSNSRSIRDTHSRLSASVALPPTPITNPEKFGIRKQNGSQPQMKVLSKTEEIPPLDPLSPSDSQSSFDTDNLDGIVSVCSSPARSVVSPAHSTASPAHSTASPAHQVSNSINSSPAHKKGRGFMAAVTSIFRSSPSPITSPDSSKPSPVRRSRAREGEGGQPNICLHEQGSQPTVPPSALTRKINSEVLPPFFSQDAKQDELMLKKLSESKLPPHLVERLEKRLSSKGQIQANRSAMARVRRVQEIQRELGVIEVQCADIEKEGVVLEKTLANISEPEHAVLMAQWYRLLGDKNSLIRREQELMVESKQLELIELADREECELVRVDAEEASSVLDRLARIAEQREQLESMLDRDRERYRREDREIRQRMEQQGIRGVDE